MVKDREIFEREKKAANPRRETIRQIRRMIYPSSRGSSNASRRTRATLSSREIPFMQFVSGRKKHYRGVWL